MKFGLKYWRSSIVVVMVGMALIMSTPVVFASANPNPGVLPKQSKPDGQTFGELSNAWWQWALSIPTSENPLIGSYSGDPQCSAGQSGSVWFLAGTFFGGSATRTCTVPAGKTLFFPTDNFFTNNVGIAGNPNCPLTHFSIPTMWGMLDQSVASVTSHAATVDGVPQQDHRAGPNNPPFNIKVPGVSLLTLICPIPAGTYSPNVSDGFYVMLAPLSKGPHTISIEGAAPGFTLDVTYNLTVQ